jgi:GNAT superfamily N-acetyltransferase
LTDTGKLRIPLGRANLPAGQCLLREPPRAEHIKPRPLGHWGTTPGLNFIYVHLNRCFHDLNMTYVCGPGHGGLGMVANTYLEGSYSKIYPDITGDADGIAKLFRQFSFRGGIPSHAAPALRGQGLGRKIVNALVAHAKGQGVRNVYCSLQTRGTSLPDLALFRSIEGRLQRQSWIVAPNKAAPTGYSGSDGAQPSGVCHVNS